LQPVYIKNEKGKRVLLAEGYAFERSLQVIIAPRAGSFKRFWVSRMPFSGILCRSFSHARHTAPAHFAGILILTFKIECRMTFYLVVFIP